VQDANTSVDEDDERKFTTSPLVCWFIIGGSSFFVVLFFAISFHDLVSDPSKVPAFAFLGAALFVGGIAIGVYYLTLKIYVTETALVVSSLFRRRCTALRDITSVVVEDNVQWRTLYAHNRRNQRVLYISDTALSEFDALADLLSAEVADRRRPQS
jgi:hypothetical protein